LEFQKLGVLRVLDKTSSPSKINYEEDEEITRRRKIKIP
jgi:hypothetical protein